METCSVLQRRRWPPIGTKYGDDAAQEWTSEKRAILPEPAYSNTILDRQAERVKATKDRVNLKLSSLQQESLAIDEEIKVAPTDRKLMTEKRDIVDQILRCEIELRPMLTDGPNFFR
jgi:hypothetical protein